MSSNNVAYKVMVSQSFNNEALIVVLKDWIKKESGAKGFVIISDKRMAFLHVELHNREAGIDLFRKLNDTDNNFISFIKTNPVGFLGLHLLSGNKESYGKVVKSLSKHDADCMIAAMKDFPDQYKEILADCFNKLFHASLKFPLISEVEKIPVYLRELMSPVNIPSSANSKINISKEPVGASFSASAWMQRYYRQEIKKIKKHSLDFELENKRNGYLFADMLKLRRPKVLFTRIKLKEIEEVRSVVIKPFKGANLKGVYVIDGTGVIKDLEHDIYIDSFYDLKLIMKSLVVRGKVEDYWIIEELIESKREKYVRDLKFYTFYGEVGLVQEEAREPTRFCYYDERGVVVETGRYKEKSFVGDGVPQEYFELAKKISLEVPTPMLRIDFMESNDGPVLGEFTPGPGNFHKYNVWWERNLGVSYAKARARLFLDLYEGKSFSMFKHFLYTISK